MWLLKFHLKYWLYQLIFIKVLLSSTTHYKKNLLLEFYICILGLRNNNDNINKNSNIATISLHLLCGRHCANSSKELL